MQFGRTDPLDPALSSAFWGSNIPVNTQTGLNCLVRFKYNMDDLINDLSVCVIRSELAGQDRAAEGEDG